MGNYLVVLLLLLRAQMRKKYPGYNSHYTIMDHVKRKNYIPVSPDE
jgi:hypothetical protein